MFSHMKNAIRNTCAALARIALIFLILSVSFDTMTRLYFAYVPVELTNFQSVTLIMRDGEAIAVIQRRATDAWRERSSFQISPVAAASEVKPPTGTVR